MVASALSEQVVAITQEYLGPASERFIHRLISTHLDKDPSQLTARDLPKLTEWVKVSLGMLTEDKRLVDDCERKILKLISD
jgi:hypothetical protein